MAKINKIYKTVGNVGYIISQIPGIDLFEHTVVEEVEQYNYLSNIIADIRNK